ncbi:TPA: hypothetical protein ACS55J_000723 [Salmonella enterica]
MLTIYQPLNGAKMIKFQDIRDKYNEVVRLQKEENERLRQIAEMVMCHFENSLALEQPTWANLDDDQANKYVFISTDRGGVKTQAALHELTPDTRGILSFFIGLTVDKSPISFPKVNLFTKLSLCCNGNGFTATVGDGLFEMELSAIPIESELAGISEATKRAMLCDLDNCTPKRR